MHLRKMVPRVQFGCGAGMLLSVREVPEMKIGCRGLIERIGVAGWINRQSLV